MIATTQEVQGAQAFLRYLNADWHNNDLIRAIVAWLHQESGGLTTTIGNNPFNLRPGKDISDLMNGVRLSRNGNGYFATFATMAQGFEAAAARLLRAGNDWRGYAAIVAAARSTKRGYVVGLDFLNAVAYSAWDVSHYGLVPSDQIGVGWIGTNHLIAVYDSITGLTLSVPPPVKPAPRRPHPKVPKHLENLAPPGKRPEYIGGFDALHFYEARHPKTS